MTQDGTGPRPLAVLLGNVEHYVQRYVALDADQSCAVTLFAAHSHALEAADTSPYLDVSSAERRSGKSRLLEVSCCVVARPWLTGRTSPAALYRKLDAESSTLLLDESDAAFGSDKEYAEALRGALNAGWRRGLSSTVCVGQGTKIEVREFFPFGPKMIAGIGRLPDTVQDRSIPIRMKRRKRSEPVERFRWREATEKAKEIRLSLELWASSPTEVIEPLRAARPDLPEELSDRAQDVWEPLLAIADMAGGEWPERARVAAVRLMGREHNGETLGHQLLADCKAAFKDEGADRITSKGLRARLIGMEESPWGDWRRGDPISLRKISELLHEFGIGSRTIRFAADAGQGLSQRVI